MRDTKIIETNVITRHHFKVDRQVKYVEDQGIRIGIPVQISRKQVELAKLMREKANTFTLIQSTQKRAFELERDMVVIVNGREVTKVEEQVKSRQLFEYVDQILIPQLHHIERDMEVIKRQIDNLKARL